MPTTASAPRIFPSGCAPTSSATPTNPTATPTSRAPVTRCSWKIANASTATKIGTDAWMIDASPESSRVSPHESSQNGIAVLISPMTTSHGQCARNSAADTRPPSVTATKTTSAIAASPTRPSTSVAGDMSRTATLMNMNELPQMTLIAASSSRLRTAALSFARRRRCAIGLTRAVRCGSGTCTTPSQSRAGSRVGRLGVAGSLGRAGFVGWRHDQVPAHDVPHHRSRSQPRVLRGARLRVPPRHGHRPRRRASRRRTTSTASPTSSRSWS